MKTLFMFFLLTTSALADVSISTTCHRSYGTRSCATVLRDLSPPAPKSAEELAREAQEDAKWLAFCKPARRQDSEGLVRWTYAHKGCDLGRSE